MVLFNYSTKELTAKIVYYGPGLCGKTTNLQYIHQNLPGNVKGKMLSLATKTDRTLFFDFLPIDLGEIRGMKTRVQLYTVPGQVFYNETRKLVLKGADGIVFVADSQQQMLSANAESFKNLEENLKGHGLKLSEMPHVIQFNKRDLPKLASIEEMNAGINKYNAPFYESVATTGIGVHDTLKAITKLVLLNLTRKYDPQALPAEQEEAAPPPPVAAEVPSVQSVPASVGAAGIPLSANERPSAPVSEESTFASAPRASSETMSMESAPSSGETRAIQLNPGTDSDYPSFGANEIQGLVDEVAESGNDVADSMPAFEPQTAPTYEDETDLGVPSASAAQASPQAESSMQAGADLELTEVVDDDELFADPSLEVARISKGEEREIVIPVELSEGQAKRRFKLSLRLRLDPVGE